MLEIPISTQFQHYHCAQPEPFYTEKVWSSWNSRAILMSITFIDEDADFQWLNYKQCQVNFTLLMA